MCRVWKNAPTSIQGQVPSPALIFTISYWKVFPDLCSGFQGGVHGSWCIFRTLQGRWCPCIRPPLGTALSARGTAVVLAALADTQLTLRRGKSATQKQSNSFKRLFEAPEYMWWQADKKVLHAEKGRICLCLLVCSPFLKKVSPAFRLFLRSGLALQ